MLSLLIANLHYHDDQMNAELKDVFVNNLVALILSQIRLQAASTEETHRKILDVAVQNANELFKTVSNFGPPICENEKCRLLDEVDVGLLSDFIDKLKAARAKLNDKE